MPDPSNGKLGEYRPKGQSFFQYADPETQYDQDSQVAGTQGTQAIPGAQLPEINPLAKSLYESSLKGYQDYSAKMPGMQDEFNSQAGQAARFQTKEGTRRNRNAFNSRGLLSSGGRVAADSRVAGQAQTGLAAAIRDNNGRLQAGKDQLAGNVFSSAATLAQPGGNVADPYLSGVQSNIASMMADQQASAQAYGGIAQGLLAAGGYGAAAALYPGQRGNPYGATSDTTAFPSYYSAGGSRVY
jgi:hypothetical protein